VGGVLVAKTSSRKKKKDLRSNVANMLRGAGQFNQSTKQAEHRRLKLFNYLCGAPNKLIGQIPDATLARYFQQPESPKALNFSGNEQEIWSKLKKYNHLALRDNLISLTTSYVCTNTLEISKFSNCVSVLNKSLFNKAPKKANSKKKIRNAREKLEIFSEPERQSI